MPFYTGDWLKDPELSLCTPATRGVWADLISRMHESGRVGSLSGTLDQLARLARCLPADVALAMTDLQTTGAADVTYERNGVITVTNRRMNREAKEREANALRQSRHRGSKSSNGHITALSRLYEVEDDNAFLSGFPEIVRSEDFRKVLNDWLEYKNARAENYQATGLAAMISRAANLGKKYGMPAVIDAMERAMANNWAGWDQQSTWRELEKPSRSNSADDPRGNFAAAKRYLEADDGE